MIPPLIQQALHKLELIRKEVGLPGVGERIERAVESLNLVGSGITPASEVEVIRAAILQVQEAMALIQAAPALDPSHEAAAAKILRMLVPLVAPVPGAPASPGALAVVPRVAAVVASPRLPAVAPPAAPAAVAGPSAPVAVAVAVARASTAAEATQPLPLVPQAPLLSAAPSLSRDRDVSAERDRDAKAVLGQIALLSAALERRARALDGDPGVRADDVEPQEERIAALVEGLSWTDAPALASLRTPAPVEEGGTDPIARGLALLHAGGSKEVKEAVRCWEGASRDDAFPEVLLTGALASVPRERLLCVSDLLLSSTDDRLRAAALPALSLIGPIPSRRLVALLASSDERLIIEAAEALAWSGHPELAAFLESHGRQGSPARAGALLLAAVASGSAAALARVRALVDRGGAIDPHVIDALAVAGDASDAERLLGVARVEGPEQARAVFAVGHLGSEASGAGLVGLRGQVDDRLLDEAVAAIYGEIPTVDRLARPLSGRRLRGQPWTVEGVLARLGREDEPLSARERLALDLAVRTGVRPPRRYDARALGPTRRSIEEAWLPAFAAIGRGALSGGWYFHGGPVPPSTPRA